MATRKAPNLYTLAVTYFCGIKRTMSPLALEEIKSMGFSPAVRPDNYVEDTSEGWMQDVSLFLKLNHMIVSGPAGTGKDVLVEAFCHAFNLPLARFAFKQGTNPVDWIFRTALVGDGKGGTMTKEVEGDLLKACRGVSCKRDFTGATQTQLNQAIESMEKSGYTVVNDGGMIGLSGLQVWLPVEMRTVL